MLKKFQHLCANDLHSESIPSRLGVDIFLNFHIFLSLKPRRERYVVRGGGGPLIYLCTGDYMVGFSPCVGGTQGANTAPPNVLNKIMQYSLR